MVSIEDRFWAKVDISSGPNGCWPWTASGTGTGYGQFWANGKRVLAHRFAYELANGPVPDGFVIDHLCRNRGCQNRQHLEAVLPYTNLIRGISFSAVNKAKTKCHNGHPFDEVNTRIGPDGRRHCRPCKRERNARYRAEAAA